MAGYSTKLMDFVRQPRHGGALADATVVGRSSHEGRAPYTNIYLAISDDLIRQAAFQTFGCGVSIAACEVLCEWVTGRSLNACYELEPDILIQELDGVPSERRFCVQLAIDALRSALNAYRATITPGGQICEE